MYVAGDVGRDDPGDRGRRHEDYDEKTGETYWAGFSPLHDTLNIGTTPYIALLVEVKYTPAKAPPAK
jgi:hypothetical protein